jgi:hypothetical protein
VIGWYRLISDRHYEIFSLLVQIQKHHLEKNYLLNRPSDRELDNSI